MEDLIGITLLVLILAVLSIYLIIERIKLIRQRMAECNIHDYTKIEIILFLLLISCLLFLGIQRIIPDPYYWVLVVVVTIGLYFYKKGKKHNG